MVPLSTRLKCQVNGEGHKSPLYQQDWDVELMEKATNGPLPKRVRCQVNGEGHKWPLYQLDWDVKLMEKATNGPFINKSEMSS
jgi:hypothetical protein